MGGIEGVGQDTIIQVTSKFSVARCPQTSMTCDSVSSDHFVRRVPYFAY